MRNSIVTITVLLFSILIASAQTPPITPTPPNTTHTSTSTSSSYSITFDTDDDSSNSSISIKDNDDVYRFRASFNKNKTSSIRKMLLDKFGKKNLRISDKTYYWSRNKNGEEVFECKLSNGRLRIFVDKEYASGKFYKMIGEFGDEIKDKISGSNSKKDKEIRAERELERAQRDLDRAKRDLARAKRRMKKNR